MTAARVAIGTVITIGTACALIAANARAPGAPDTIDDVCHRRIAETLQSHSAIIWAGETTTYDGDRWTMVGSVSSTRYGTVITDTYVCIVTRSGDTWRGEGIQIGGTDIGWTEPTESA